MSISSWRRVILSTAGLRDCTACSISLIALILHFMLTIQRLFIDTDHTFGKKNAGSYVSEHVGKKRNSLQGKFRLKSLECLGICVLSRVDELLFSPTANCTLKEGSLSKPVVFTLIPLESARFNFKPYITPAQHLSKVLLKKVLSFWLTV